METITWISLYIVQTLLGAVLWRIFVFNDNFENSPLENAFTSFIASLINPISVPLYLFLRLILIICNFLAGVKKIDVLKKIQKDYEKFIKDEKL